MQILLAIDSFKGCLSSEEVEAAFSQALTARGADVRSLPMSDGGEGMLPAFITALHGQLLETEVHDPLMRPVTASYGLTPDGTAVIETAQACGLTRLSAEERNPLVATTYGVGELVAHAFQQGARRFIIGLGGSGTSDAGKGMLQGLTNSLAPGGMTEDILNGPLAGCSFVLASDVRNPLYGPEGAAHIFAPQKGATPEMVEELDRRARQFAEESARRMGKDTSSRPGAGAAGGLGYAFLQYLQATTQSGADLLLDLSGFDRLLADTGLVITGEGHADRQTLMGKLPERGHATGTGKACSHLAGSRKSQRHTSPSQCRIQPGGQSCTGQHASGRSHPSGSHPGKYPPVGRIRMESAADHMIRIDNLDGETMRYASWKRRSKVMKFIISRKVAAHP